MKPHVKAAFCLIISAVGLTACVLPLPPARMIARTSPTASIEVSSQAAPIPTSTPDNDPFGKTAIWGFPTDVEGWRLQIFDQEGVNLIENSRGCQYSTTQGIFDLTAGTPAPDHIETRYMAENRIASFQRQMTSAKGTFHKSSEVSGPGSQPIEMLRVDIDYVGVDHRNYRSTAWVRAFTRDDPPSAMTVNYACPVEAYSEQELKELLDSTWLINVTTPELGD